MLGIIIFILAISFTVMYYFQQVSMDYKQKYPKINCPDFMSEYRDREAQLQIDAIWDYKLNKEAFDSGKDTTYSGALQCFCKQQRENGVSNDQTYTLYKQDTGEVQYEEEICQEYFGDMTKSFLIGNSIGVLIPTVNVILKTIIIILVKWIGEPTYSLQKSAIVRGVFFAQFFNTGFLPLLANANMSEHDPKFITSFITGPLYDYVPDWYQNVGMKILLSVFIMSFSPYINLTVAAMKPYVLQQLDSGFTGDIYKTKKTAMYQYKAVYSGQDYLIHFKYAEALVVIYVTMMYGIGIPILFPIATLFLFNARISERISVAYFSKQPPAMGDTLSTAALDLMKYAPIVMMFNGYWMLGNKQIF